MNSNSSHCVQKYKYFWSSEYQKTAYHSSALIGIPLSILVFYLIVARTPKRMEQMKWVILNAHTCALNMDLLLNFLICPFAFFPSTAGITLGFLSSLDVEFKLQTYCIQVSISLIAIAAVMLFENRQNQIFTIKKLKITRKSTRIAYYSINYLIAFMVPLPFYMSDTDQNQLMELVLKRIPCPTIEFFQLKTYALLRGDEIIPFISICFAMGWILFQTFFFVFHSIYHLFYVTNVNLSNSTKALQKKFLAAVSIQVTIPFAAFVVPIIYSLYADRFNYYNQAFNNNAMLVMGTHGILESVATILIYRPYLDVILRTIHRDSLKVEIINLRTMSTNC